MDLKELKAEAYDILSKIEYLQLELRKVNEQIRQASVQESAKVIETDTAK